MSVNLPLQISATGGPVPTPPDTIYSTLINNVAASVPGYTASLPGSLVDDIAGTDVAAVAIADAARVEAVQSVSPVTANPYVLGLLGQQTGIPQGTPTNGNVDVQFSGSVGFVIPAGWVVGDGTHQYVIQDGGTVGTSGLSQILEAICTDNDVFPIAAGTVTTNITTVPPPYTLTVTNPQAGVAATGDETVESYRARLLQASQFQLQGGPTVLKTLLQAVPGVSSRLVSVIQYGSLWIVLCGGGDPYQVAGAIYQGVTTIGLLAGSAISSGRNIEATIFDAPNTYTVTFVNPPSATVTIDVVWNTTLSNFTASAAVNQFILTAVPAYINSIVVGQPINQMVLTEMIQEAIAPVLSAANLTTLTYTVKINGSPVSPSAGTSIYPPPDDETYFTMATTGVTSTQG